MIRNKKAGSRIKIVSLIVLVVLMSSFIIKQKQNYSNNSLQSLDTEFLSSNSTLDVTNDDEAMPVFKYSTLSDEIIDKIVGVSWKENSPVNLGELSYINVTYWGFDGNEHIGEMIVHKNLALEITEIFKELYDGKFFIEKIRLIDEYNANDELSMADNNTSAFCSREVTGKKGVFSNHSYGIAIDINPIQNPYVKGDTVLPKEGEPYLDRSSIRKGMIIKGDVCYTAFKDRGWIWGGEWNSLKDYQHFEKNIELD